MMTIGVIEMVAFCVGMGVFGGLELDNGTLALRLDSVRGVERIARVDLARGGGRVLKCRSADPHAMPLEGGRAGQWTRVDDKFFLAAESLRTLEDGIVATRWVGLTRAGSMFRTQVRLRNTGNSPRAIPWFPVWSGTMEVRGGIERVRWWRALTFEADACAFSDMDALLLHSRLHSSDTRYSEDGVNPYWVLEGDACRVYFSLDWCGGWRAELRGKADGIVMDVRLPEDETQLILEPGEAIAGPVLTVTVVAESGERESRADWMRQRVTLGKALYGGPEPSYPFTYNHWYATRFDVDAEFLRRQVAAMDPYGFDYFIVDAGWYEGCGEWVPDPRKFEEGEFESILRSSVDRGVPVGIWTCPQFLQADGNSLPPQIDRPGTYERFIDGHLLDMAGMGFTDFLLEHVAQLRQRYEVDWWKYDQLLFAENTRHGVMKNVVAFQDALRAVREANPTLMIENCQSGGRMINEFTVLATQNQWIRDGGDTGFAHARRIMGEVLGAVEFLPPWTCNRWTNNPDRNDENDDEFTRMYCRCAMPGTWGLVADLDKIGQRQREIILRETANYRRLNELKGDYLYDVKYPEAGRAAAGITYYDASGSKAGILLCRWDAEGEFVEHVKLDGLRSDKRYATEDVDTKAIAELPGTTLRDRGYPVAFDRTRMSALVFIQAVEH